MLFIIGFIVVIGCVVGGYAAPGGHLGVLWQPFEFIIIFGGAIGAFIIGNSGPVLKQAMGDMKLLFKGTTYKKDAYLELLTMLYQIFKMVKTKGVLAIEQHVEKPDESELFKQFPGFYHDHHKLEFLCDYLRLWTLGTDNPHQLEDLLNGEIDHMNHENDHVTHAIQLMADGMPALGIVAAVLGVIHTMGSITEPPEVLGHLIGAALVGTFSGVLLSYGFIAPMASNIKSKHTEEFEYYSIIKAGLLAHMNGFAPAVSVEFARKSVSHHFRPTFYEVEEAVQKLPPV